MKVSNLSNMSTSPWKKVPACTEAQKLSDIMLEQYTTNRQVQQKQHLATYAEEKHNYVSTSKPKDSEDALSKHNQTDTNMKIIECDSDGILAKLLQYQFDKEYDDEITKLEKHSKNAKVSISYGNYRNKPKHAVDNFDSEGEDIEIADKKYWTYFETNDKQISSLVHRRDAIKDDEMTTILDTINNGRQNAGCDTIINPTKEHKVPGFCIKLSNIEIDNFLRQLGQYHPRHTIRDKRQQQALFETCFDEATRLLLFELIHEGLLDVIDGVISIKKEYIILHAVKYSNENPKEFAIKVFRTTFNRFKVYNKGVEVTYKSEDLSKQNPTTNEDLKRAVREMNNLITMKNINLNCPDVICLREHVLVMTFVGENKKPGPKLKDVQLRAEVWLKIYETMVWFMHTLYNSGQLIHEDLTERTIVWWKERCWFNVAHVVPRDHPNGWKILLKGCCNIWKFFDKKEVPSMKSPEDLFKSITGLNEIDAKLLKLINKVTINRKSDDQRK